MRKILIGTILLITSISLAEVPKYINYQGRLVLSGVPVTGNKNMTFRIWDNPTVGTVLWEEVHDGTPGHPRVTVTNGLFNVKLGEVTSLPEIVFNNVFTYLEVEVEGTILGRERLVTVPYAYHSAVSDQAVNATTAGNADTVDGKHSNEFVSKAGDTMTGDLSVPRIYANYMLSSGNVDIQNGLNVLQDCYLNRAYVGDYMRVPRLTSSTGRIDIEGNLYVPRIYVDGARIDNDGAYLHLGRDINGDGLITTSGKDLIINTYENLSTGRGGTVYIGSLGLPLSPDNNLFVKGDIYALHKSAVVSTANYGERVLYSREGPEVKFIDEGEAELVNGTAKFFLEPIFKETIETENYLLQITPLGECNGLYVSERTSEYFTVKELKSGTSNIKFVWQISGYRKNSIGKRLEEFKMPEQKQ